MSPAVRLLAACLIALSVPALAAQSASPDPSRFAAEIRAFAAWDAKNAAPTDGILFVGSSTIRLWATAEQFPGLPVINRGFGGSQIADVNRFVAETVTKYAPDIVVFYAGDNDINDGKTSQAVFDDYRAFVMHVRTAKPTTHIVFLAIKPSVARWRLWPVMKEANQRVKDFTAGFSAQAVKSGRPATLHFVDVATPMLGPNESMPSASLFVEDGLHMTAEGYAIWTRILTPVLTQLRSAAK